MNQLNFFLEILNDKVPSHLTDDPAFLSFAGPFEKVDGMVKLKKPKEEDDFECQRTKNYIFEIDLKKRFSH